MEKKICGKSRKTWSSRRQLFRIYSIFRKKKVRKKTRLNKDFKQKGKIHICFTVKNIETIFKKLRKEKIKFISKPLHSDFDPVKTCFFYDPEDNLIQLVEGKNSL